MELININNSTTMSSIDLLKMINGVRREFGEPEVRNNDFLKRIEDELEGEIGITKVSQNPSGGRPKDYYELTIDQCTLVGMRESKGVRRAVLAKLKELIKPLTAGEMLVMHANRFLEIEREQARLAVEQAEMKSQLAAIVNGEDFFTIVGYCNMTRRRLSQKETARMGKIASSYCRDNDIESGKSKHPHFGQINSYPIEALKIVFGD